MGQHLTDEFGDGYDSLGTWLGGVSSTQFSVSWTVERGAIPEATLT